jgi:hypothetical protein
VLLYCNKGIPYEDPLKYFFLKSTKFELDLRKELSLGLFCYVHVLSAKDREYRKRWEDDGEW